MGNAWHVAVIGYSIICSCTTGAILGRGILLEVLEWDGVVLKCQLLRISRGGWALLISLVDILLSRLIYGLRGGSAMRRLWGLLRCLRLLL